MMVDLYSTWQENYGIIAMLFVLIFLLVNVIKYMFARMFLDQRAMAISVAEILDGFAVAVGIVFLVFIVNGINEFFVYSGMPIHLLAIQESKLSTALLLQSLNELYVFAVADSMGTYRHYSLTIGLVGIPIYQGSWVQGIVKQLSFNMFVVQKVTELSVFLVAQYHVLNYIEKNMLAVFLPLGIILRAAKVTRGMGALFISVAIGLYYIYPALLFFSASGFTAPPKIPVTTETECNYPTYLALARGFDFDFSGFAFQSVRSLSYMMTVPGFISAVFYNILLSNLVALSLTFVFIRFASVVLGGMPTAFVSMVSKLV